MKPLRRLKLDDKGDCIAEERVPGVWHICRIDPFGGKHTVILTIKSIKFLAAQS